MKQPRWEAEGKKNREECRAKNCGEEPGQREKAELCGSRVERAKMWWDMHGRMRIKSDAKEGKQKKTMGMKDEKGRERSRLKHRWGREALRMLRETRIPCLYVVWMLLHLICISLIHIYPSCVSGLLFLSIYKTTWRAFGGRARHFPGTKKISF